MKASVLKSLRKEAKSNVYMIPIAGDPNRIVICKTTLSISPICSRSWDVHHKYYWNGYTGEEMRENIPDWLRSKNRTSLGRPFTRSEAETQINKIRREYILQRVEEMRKDWNITKEKWLTWLWRNTK